MSPTAEREGTAARPDSSIQSTSGEVPTGEVRPARPLGSATGEPDRASRPDVRGGLEPGKGAEVPTRRPDTTEPKREGAPGDRDVSGREPVIQHAETIDTITVGIEKHKRQPKKKSTDVFFILEPATFFLLGLGAVMVGRKRGYSRLLNLPA